MHRALYNFISLITLLFGTMTIAHAWQSSIVYFDKAAKLVYEEDNSKNKIPDFSHAGYQGGGVDLPDIDSVETISPIDGDNTEHIQQAIDLISKRSPNSSGHRGALLLSPGSYQVSGSLKILNSGVILRGSGNGDDPSVDTIIEATGNTPHQRQVIQVGNYKHCWEDKYPNTTQNITTNHLSVGERTFSILDASNFKRGDDIVIYHPCTQAWLDAVRGGDTDSDDAWSVGQLPIVYIRVITAIEDNTITIDAPVYNHLIKSLSQSYIYKFNNSKLISEVAVENLRIKIQTPSPTSENHAWTGIRFMGVENAWAKNISILHFGYAGIEVGSSRWITVKDSQALEPHAIAKGGRMYNFNLRRAAQLVLYQNCKAEGGRHNFISNGTSTTSGCVFLRCISLNPKTSSEGHRQWSTGILFDRMIDSGTTPSGERVLALYNRGSWGTGHGWSLAHSVAWNCDLSRPDIDGKIVVQKPPTAQNYAIGCKGTVTGDGPYPQPAGFIEGTNREGLEPESLYEAQLKIRGF